LATLVEARTDNSPQDAWSEWMITEGVVVSELEAPNTMVEDTYDAVADHFDKDRSRETYETILPIYLELLTEHNSGLRRILDLGCGTGILTGMLAENGYEVVGLDLSEKMLQLARDRHSSIPFIQGDFTRLPDLGRFDAAVTSGEPFNYLPDEAALTGTLLEVAAQLDIGGVVLFDLLSRRSFRRMVAKPLIDEPGGVFRVTSAADDSDPSRITITERRFTPHGKLWQQTVSEHRYALFDTAAITRALSVAGFTEITLRGINLQRLQDVFLDDEHAWCLAIARKAA
jgi:SAM-dependent methyltransferase